MGQWQSQEVCNTPACIHASSMILKTLAPNWRDFDPCTEFDKMVCYGTFEHHGIDSDTSTAIGIRTRNLLRQIIESDNHGEAAGVKSTFLKRRATNADEESFEMLRDAYAACMDGDTIQLLGASPLAQVVDNINAVWSANASTLNRRLSESDYEGLHAANILVSAYGVGAFYGYCDGESPVIPDPLNTRTGRVCFTLPSTYQRNLSAYADPATMSAYANNVAAVLRLVMPGTSAKTALSLAEAAVNFEAESVATFVENMPVVHSTAEFALELKNVTLSELAKIAPPLGLDKLVKALTPSGATPDSVLMLSPKIWAAWSDVIKKHSPAAVHSFLVWQTVHAMAVNVYDPTIEEIFGMNSFRERGNRCLGMVNDMLQHVLDRYYINATYTEQAHNAVTRMTDNIQAQFKKQVSESKWMSAKAKQRAAAKIDRIQKNIGYPKSHPDLRSAESVRSFYAGLNITASTHFANALNAQSHKTLRGYAQVGQAPDRGRMGDIKQVNAFYDPLRNSIAILAGYSHLPAFHPSLPTFAQYGALGFIIGHEFAHSVDSSGRGFNEDGEARAWWDAETVAGFEERAQCFVDQYGSYTVEVPGGRANVNGNLTLGENLADAGGLRAAYDAWVVNRDAMPSVWDQSLPGLEDFTHEQLFFLFYAHGFCDTTSPFLMEQIYLPDEHSPHQVRILAGLDNSKAFKEAWKCKSKEPKCSLF
ncbi:hypothetical protein VTJ83DRAFT_6936 [Remersonia thermophila]|uniref:Uncharacterized protein n=1 Tax=Remersonia thermophila TaxID=72144 RepID=A0ABR4D7L3_9PEZI